MDNLSCKAPTLPSRWSRKEHPDISFSTSINQSLNASLQLNISMANVASALPSCNLSIPSSQGSNKTPTSSPSRLKTNRSTPHQSFNQSRKSVHRTGGKTVKTPLGPDRFIPDRSAINLDVSHYLLTNNIEVENGDQRHQKDPDIRRRRALSDALNGDLTNYRMMPCKENRLPKDTFSEKKSTHKKQRAIPSQPEKILDAPEVKNDFYLQLLDWSDTNVLAVALDRDVYLWNAASGEITPLLTLPGPDYIASLSWIQGGNVLAIGTGDGEPNVVQLWDCSVGKKLRSMRSHSSRASSLSWNSHILSSGDRNGEIHNHDVRVENHLIGKFLSHNQDICGLKWSPTGDYLASGSNDNVVYIWPNSPSGESSQPLHSFKKHKAAVKAISWCPWKPSLLATGGGTADKFIHVWNVNSCETTASVDTGSQVCSLLWSKQYRELVSGHGHTDNQLTIWQYPGLTKTAELNGHTNRILGMSMSPDGQTVVSLGADETLRFWECFQEDKELKRRKETSTKENIITNPIRMMSIR